MTSGCQQTISSMGNNTQLTLLSQKPYIIPIYYKHQFVQVRFRYEY